MCSNVLTLVGPPQPAVSQQVVVVRVGVSGNYAATKHVTNCHVIQMAVRQMAVNAENKPSRCAPGIQSRG